jgi:hypothetical protein
MLVIMLDARTATTVISGRALTIDGFVSGIIFPIISISKHVLLYPQNLQPQVLA